MIHLRERKCNIADASGCAEQAKARDLRWILCRICELLVCLAAHFDILLFLCNLQVVKSFLSGLVTGVSLQAIQLWRLGKQ